MTCCNKTLDTPPDKLTAISDLIWGLLEGESDYYAHVIKDDNCVGQRNVVIRLYDDCRADTEIYLIGKTIRKILSDAHYDVATSVQQPFMQVLDEAEYVCKRCVVIRTSAMPKEVVS